MKMVALNPPPAAAAKLLHVPPSVVAVQSIANGQTRYTRGAISVHVRPPHFHPSFFIPFLSPSPKTKMITQPNKFSLDVQVAHERNPSAHGTFSDLLYDPRMLCCGSARWREEENWRRRRRSRRSDFRTWYFSSPEGRFVYHGLWYTTIAHKFNEMGCKGRLLKF